MGWTDEQLKSLPQHYQDQVKAQCESGSEGIPLPHHEPGPGNDIQGQVEDQTGTEEGLRPRYIILIISHRTRLTHSDGIYSKHLIDSLIEYGVIPDDSKHFVENVFTIQKRTTKGNERTEIELYEITGTGDRGEA